MFFPVIGMFFIALLSHLLFCAKKNKRGCLATKMLLVPLLACLHLSMDNGADVLVLLALACCFLGDCFLEVPGNTFFHVGLFSFLVGHLIYGAHFAMETPFTHVPWGMVAALPGYFVFGVWFYCKLDVQDKKKRVSTAIYCMTILVMSVLALFRAMIGSEFPLWIAYIGSVLFVASDALLSYNRFKRKIRHGGVWVMATYGMAQLLIVLGQSSFVPR